MGQYAAIVVLAMFVFIGLITTSGALRVIWRITLPRAGVFLILGSLVSTLLGQSEAASLNGIPLDPLRVARAIVFGVLFLVATGILLRRPAVWRTSGSPVRWMLLFGLMAAVSAFWSVNWFVSLWKGFEVLTLVMLAVALGGSVDSPERARGAVNVLALGLLAVWCTVIASVVLFPRQAFDVSESGVRMANGLFPLITSSSVGSIGAILTVLGLAKLVGSRSGQALPTDLPLRFWGLLMSCGVVGLLLSHSRTTIIASAIGALFLVMVFKRYALAFVVVLLSSALYLMSSAPEVLTEYMLRGQTQEQFYALTGRTHFWESVWTSIEQAPLIGHGYYAGQRVLMGTSTVDNAYLEVLLGLGALGLAIFLAPLLAVGQALLRGKRRLGNSLLLVTWAQVAGVLLVIAVRAATAPAFQVMHPLLVVYLVCLVATMPLATWSRGRERAPFKGSPGAVRRTGLRAPTTGLRPSPPRLPSN